MRKAIIAGNWKMNNTIEESKKLVKDLLPLVNNENIDVVVCPSYLSLKTVVELTHNTNIKVGAQNMHYEVAGAFTGEITAEMLEELGVEYVIIGHSERRQYFNETDETVNKKAIKAIQTGLIPIICVGETLEEREEGNAENVIINQIEKALSSLSKEEISNVIIAYEPIWAIGTGKTATSIQAEEACGWIRKKIKQLTDDSTSEKVRIQYGGSVKPENIAELMEQKNIDGALVGGASLKPEQFAGIVNY